LWVLSIELVLRHHSGVWSFEVASRFFEILCPPVLTPQ